MQGYVEYSLFVSSCWFKLTLNLWEGNVQPKIYNFSMMAANDSNNIGRPKNQQGQYRLSNISFNNQCFLKFPKSIIKQQLLRNIERLNLAIM